MAHKSDLPWDHLLLDCRLASLCNGLNDFGIIENAALAWRNGTIVFAAAQSSLPNTAAQLAQHVESVAGALVTPGLIDCHTHLVFAGDRAQEFEARLNGASYEQIAKNGGGIVSTVKKTRAASEEALFNQSVSRARALLRDGVTTLEIKSGYGLDLASECKMLHVARRIGTELGMTVRTTFLGAHCVPPEFQQRKAEYLDLLCNEMLPAVANQGLADAVDAYCETIAFTAQEIRRLFHEATRLGLRVKLHADQLSDSSGAALAAECNALSADHLEYTNPQGIQALAATGTVAVLLPGAFYALRETRTPPIAQMRAAGVAMAIATDLNPGTSPLLSLRQALNQACILFRLTPLEALHGATTQAAKALGLTDRGTLAIGQRADVAVWDVESPAELMYWMGGNLARRVFINGCEV